MLSGGNRTTGNQGNDHAERGLVSLLPALKLKPRINSDREG